MVTAIIPPNGLDTQPDARRIRRWLERLDFEQYHHPHLPPPDNSDGPTAQHLAYLASEPSE